VTLTSGQKATLTDGQKEAFQRDGFVIVRNFFSPEEIEPLRQACLADPSIGGKVRAVGRRQDLHFGGCIDIGDLQGYSGHACAGGIGDAARQPAQIALTPCDANRRGNRKDEKKERSMHGTPSQTNLKLRPG